MPAQESWSTPDGSEITSPGQSVQDEALRFLEQLALNDPSLASATLDAEVNTLLGRAPGTTPTKATTNEPIRIDDDDDRPEDDVDFGWYNSLLARVPALDDDRTVEAARSVEVGLFARDRLERLEGSIVKRRELAELYTLVEEGEAAWTWLILTNIRLVFHWSKGVAHSISSFWAEDAFQVGVLGLIRGIQGWDYSRGYRLSTYVSWHIRQHIQRWRANEVTLIRLPVHIWERLNHEPDTLSDETLLLIDRALNISSFEEVCERGEEESWDGGLGDVEDRFDRDRLVTQLFDMINEQQADILRRRNGIGEGDPDPMTLEQIGALYRVTRERIRQIEKKAMDKLRTEAVGLSDDGIPKRRRSKQVTSDRLD